MKNPFTLLKNKFSGKAANETTVTPQSKEAKHAAPQYIPKKIYHIAPVMPTQLAAIYRRKRNARIRMQKNSRKINFAAA
jgi:hypothetical protein